MKAPMKPGEADFLANARAAYGDALPDWIETLAKEANRTSGAAAGKRCGFGGSTVSQICSGSYGAKDWSNIEDRVRGALMNESVMCPALGDEISRDRCQAEQKKRHWGTSQQRTALYHACRNGCPHSRIPGARAEGGVNG